MGNRRSWHAARRREAPVVYDNDLGRVLPPSVGRRRSAIQPHWLEQFTHLLDIVDGDDRFRLISTRHGRQFDTDRLRLTHQAYGSRAFSMLGFPNQCALDMPDDDALEVWFNLLFD